MTASMKNYQKLHEISRHTRLLTGVSSLLGWDQETYMPSGAAGIRAEQLKSMAGLIHKEKTGRKFTTALGRLVDLKTGKIIDAHLSSEKKSALKEWYREYRRNTALPSKFVEDFTQLTSQAMLAWRSAKESNAFHQFAPYLDKIITMNRKKADYIGYQEHPYDALLDEFEPDMTTREVAGLFGQLRTVITPLLKELSKREIDDRFLHDEWDHSKQMTFGYKLTDAMTYDRNYGRIDFSSHPFSSSAHPTDCRITTRIHPTSLMSNIMVLLHETGHALYEMGLPKEEYGTPLGEARSLGVHESQSRWWETRIGLSRPFWKHFFPILQETFADKLKTITFDQFYQAINRVHPSFIRVEADEVSYPLHVILRFELEKELIEGILKVRDLPEAWNSKMEAYLGIKPKTNSEGCLQDIHWSMGTFGYFPTYALGNLYAAHLFEGFAKDHADWEKKVAQAEFKFIKDWLNEKVYRHGCRYSTHELLKQATGKEFGVDAYLNYIKGKYQ